MLRHWLATALYRASDGFKFLSGWCWDAAVWMAHRDSWSSIRARRRHAAKLQEPPVRTTIDWGRGPGVR